MNQDYSKAVAFTNSYFALADGLVTGIENCLAENVVLDWFGKTVQGRNDVAAFMNKHKVNSKHVFNEITATESIGYNKKACRRRKKVKSRLSYETPENPNLSIEKISSCESTPLNGSTCSNGRSLSSSKKSDFLDEESNLTFELNDDDNSTMFKLRNIKSTDINEIERQINQISLEQNANIASGKQVEPRLFNETRNLGIVGYSMKYVEAHGEILFSKRSRRLNTRNDCRMILSNSTQTWRKPCKLQIAYSSSGMICREVLNTYNNNLQFQYLPETKNHTIAHENYHFHNNIFKTGESLLKSFNENLFKSESNQLGLIPQYINDQIILKQTNDNDNYNSQNNFIFNHTIHVIIYEGRSRCRMNLSQKFI